MDEEYVKMFGASLDMYEKTKSKLVPFIVQIDLIGSMFESNDNSESGSAAYLEKANLIMRLTTLTKNENFDPKQKDDVCGLLLGFLSLLVEVSQDPTKAEGFMKKLTEGLEHTVNQPVDKFCFNV